MFDYRLPTAPCHPLNSNPVCPGTRYATVHVTVVSVLQQRCWRSTYIQERLCDRYCSQGLVWAQHFCRSPRVTPTRLRELFYRPRDWSVQPADVKVKTLMLYGDSLAKYFFLSLVTVLDGDAPFNYAIKNASYSSTQYPGVGLHFKNAVTGSNTDGCSQSLAGYIGCTVAFLKSSCNRLDIDVFYFSLSEAHIIVPDTIDLGQCSDNNSVLAQYVQSELSRLVVAIRQQVAKNPSLRIVWGTYLPPRSDRLEIMLLVHFFHSEMARVTIRLFCAAHVEGHTACDTEQVRARQYSSFTGWQSRLWLH